MSTTNIVLPPQSPKSKELDRTEHVWSKAVRGYFKCVLCGAVTDHPPQRPTPEDWYPDRYEKLTAKERALCPNPQ